jgi:hypothetical protein
MSRRSGKRAADGSRTSEAVAPAACRPEPDVVRRLSFVDAAEVVLCRFGNRQPMHYRDITKLALSERLVQTRGKTPEATLYARIIDENAAAKKRGREPRFERHGRGFVSLTAWLISGSQPEAPEAAASSSTSRRSLDHASEAKSRRVPIEPPPWVETMLRAAGWPVADVRELPSAPVAARNFRVGGRILDYALLAERRLLAFVETKSYPVPVELLEQQAKSLAAEARLRGRGEDGSYPGFVYLVNGPETFFMRDGGDSPRREVAGFHRPETLLRWADAPSFPVQVGRMPALSFDSLRTHQADAITALEASLASGDRRGLLELPTGAGALAIAMGQSYRLLRHTTTRRILFLVDRRDLAQQAKVLFLDFEIAGGRFGDRYSVGLADSTDLQADANVVIMTIQRLQRLMSASQIELPIDSFDFIWCQEPRSLLATTAGRLLDHFDAPIVGFGSSPSRDAAAYFDGNVVMRIDPRTIWEQADRARSAGERVRAAPPGLDIPTPAPFLLDFLQRYLHDRRATLLVDPAVSNPILPAAIVDVDAARRAVGILPSAALAELARDDYGDRRIDWTHRSLLRTVGEDLSCIGAPDLIVSFPPLWMHEEAISLNTPDGRSLELHDAAGYRPLLESVMRLAPGGEAIFMVADSFLLRNGPTRARALLNTLGLHVHAVVAVEQGITGVSQPVNLIFISHTRHETTFVGKLSPQVDTDQLISHLQRRRRGPVPELGRLVQWESFRGYLWLAAEERVALLIAETGLDTVALPEVLAEPVRTAPEPGQDLEPQENVVYLSRFPAGSVHTRPEQLTGKAGDYYQLVFDPRHALADYVALMLETPVGRALREALAPSHNRSSIPLKAFVQLQLPLPDLDVQREVSRTHGQIGSLRLELDGLERELAGNPRGVGLVAKALGEIGQRDPLTTLRETLPFPLASILWRYEADANVTDKIDHLHRFFEASAIYFAAILLSAFLSDDRLFDEERRHWGLAQSSFQLSTFGKWTHLGGRLADSVRRRLQGGGHAGEQMRIAFAVDAQRFVEAVSSRELWRLLNEARKERNRSKSHGGILGKSEQEDIHVLLGSLLTRLGGMLGEPMAEVRLVRPGAARFRSGVGHYERAELLQGSHNIFQQTELSAFPLMEADELYLVQAGSRAARNVLRVAPLLRMRLAPRSAENACYFYNSLVNEREAEFISHHFEAQPHITLQDPDLLELLARLSAAE